MRKIMPFILGQIETERENQDQQWGGAVHDDEHTVSDWREQIEKHRELELRQLAAGENGDYTEIRGRLIKIAALAVAAIESQDRVRFNHLTKENASFDDWFQQLRRIAILYGLYTSESKIDAEAWRGNFDNGEAPLEALLEDMSNM